MAIRLPARQLSPVNPVNPDPVWKIGNTLLRAMGSTPPGLFAASEWKGRIAARAMGHDAFRVALLRFVDALPQVDDDARLVALAGEYFADLAADVSPAMAFGMKILQRGGPFKKVAALVIRSQVADMARQFIVGADLDDALPVLETQWRQGGGVSVDLLGEVTHSQPEAATYRQNYLDLLTRLHAEAAAWTGGPGAHEKARADVNISVKLSALDPLLDPLAWDASLVRAVDALRPIFSRARELDAHVQVDMEYHALKDLTLAAVMALLEEAEFADGPRCGVVLQSYLMETEADLARLISWCDTRHRRLTVRLVKGAYWDQEVITHRQAGWKPPVWLHKGDTDLAYERLSCTLLNHPELIEAAFASHNPRSVAHAIYQAERRGIAPADYEFQVIHGMAEPLKQALIAQGYRVRAYCPVGALLPGMSYLVRRLLENTANTSMLRNIYRDQAPAEQVLAAPVGSVSAKIFPVDADPEPAPAPVLDPNEVIGNDFVNEPLADFSRPASRQRMADALARELAALGRHHEAVIDGQPVAAGRRIDSTDPARDERLIGSVALCGAAQVEHAVRVARAGQKPWADTPVAERAEALDQAAQLMVRERWDLAALTVLEVGKSWRDADAELAEAIDFLRFYAAEMRRLGGANRFGAAYPGEINQGGYRPRGVAAVIAPWNFPIAIATGMVCAALVSGNSVLFKPSERSPVCGARLFDLLQRAGVAPKGLQFVPGDGATGAALAQDPGVDVIAFTGSRRVGLRLNRMAAERPTSGHNTKHLIAEMGGKNAIIIDETADLDEAVAAVVDSAVGFQGQKCSACSRVIVHTAVHDRFVGRLCDALSALPIGPPEDPAHRIGPVIDARALKTVLDYVALARSEGDVVLALDAAPARDRYGGHYVGPVVACGIRPQHRLAREEVFGPLLAVLATPDLNTAIAMANDCEYALTGGLFSRSPAAIARVKRDFLVGNLYINRGITGAQVARQPFGGFRMSGLGAKAGGTDYLKQFMVPVTQTENTLRRGFAP